MCGEEHEERILIRVLVSGRDGLSDDVEDGATLGVCGGRLVVVGGYKDGVYSRAGGSL